MMKYWNDRLKKMREYIPGEQPDNLNEYIKLNTNENPFPPSAFVLDALRKACSENLNRYPNPTSLSVREIFARDNEFEVDSIFVGNGSDEIFTLIFRGFVEMGDLAAFPYPSYSLYYTMAEANGINYELINLNEELNIEFNDFLEKDYRLVIIANPNNPTGRGCDVQEIRSFLGEFKGLLVVDEAYVDFFGESAIGLVREFDNIIITRSFSKYYSLAGLRVGLAIANRDLIMGFFKLKDSYNVDKIAEAGARAALLDKKGVRYNMEMIRNNKEYLEEQLSEIGFHIVPSKANFLFVKHPELESEYIYERLKERRILVRHFNGPIQSEYIRITVGSMLEIKALIKEIKALF
jgi:histidinol-phosphate aminotransferase